MAASTVVKHLYDGTITLEDGAANSLTVPFSVGDFSLDGVMESQRDVQAYQTRGTLNSVRLSARNFPSLSFSAQLADVSDATDGTVIDFCNKQGSFSGNSSTLSDSDVYAIKITLSIDYDGGGGEAAHTIACDDVHVTQAIAEGEPDTISISGTCYAVPTFT